MNRIEEEFNIKETHLVYLFYSKIAALSGYVNQVPIFNNKGEIVDVDYEYGDYAYTEINRLEDLIERAMEEDGDNLDYLDELHEQLNAMRKRPLVGEFKKLLSKKEVILNKGIFRESLEYFFSEVENFIQSYKQNDSQELDKFCRNLLEDNNIFSSALDKYKRLSTLKRKLRKPIVIGKSSKKITIDFILWEKEDTQLLATFDIDSYLMLENLYENINGLELNMWDKYSIDSSIERIDTQILSSLQGTLKILDKTVKRTSRFFKGV